MFTNDIKQFDDSFKVHDISDFVGKIINDDYGYFFKIINVGVPMFKLCYFAKESSKESSIIDDPMHIIVKSRLYNIKTISALKEHSTQIHRTLYKEIYDFLTLNKPNDICNFKLDAESYKEWYNKLVDFIEFKFKKLNCGDDKYIILNSSVNNVKLWNLFVEQFNIYNIKKLQSIDFMQFDNEISPFHLLGEVCGVKIFLNSFNRNNLIVCGCKENTIHNGNVFVYYKSDLLDNGELNDIRFNIIENTNGEHLTETFTISSLFAEKNVFLNKNNSEDIYLI